MPGGVHVSSRYFGGHNPFVKRFYMSGHLETHCDCSMVSKHVSNINMPVKCLGFR
jgi:hypothetical protein